MTILESGYLTGVVCQIFPILRAPLPLVQFFYNPATEINLAETNFSQV